MCSDDESPMPSHRKCKKNTKVIPYNLENMIYIVSKRKKLDSIKKQYPNAIICDVTSTSPNSLVKLSPFYPHRTFPYHSHQITLVHLLKVFGKDLKCLLVKILILIHSPTHP